MRNTVIPRRTRILEVTLGFRKGQLLAKKKAGWGVRIFEARAAMRGKRGRKMTQQELGDAVGVSATQIGFYESETNEPNWATWRKLAKALLIDDPGELAFGTERGRRGRGGLGGNDAAETA